MSKELTPLQALNDLIERLEDEHLGLSEETWVVKRKRIIKKALKRIIELEEENEVLHIVRDSFDLYLESEYKSTLEFVQSYGMTQSEYEKFIDYFGKPKD